MSKLASPSGWGRALKLLAVPLLAILFIALFYIWQLGSATSGISPAEAAYISTNNDWREIADHPLYAPHRFLQYGFLQAGLDSQFFLRLPSTVFMIAFLGLFYLLLKLWFGRVVGLLGALMLAGTPWVVLVAKSAVPDILLLAPLALISAYLWLNRRQSKLNTMWFVLILLLGLSLYVPGIVWVLLVAVAAKHRQIIGVVKKVNPYAVAGGLLMFAGIVAPLAKAIVIQPALLKPLLLIPQQLEAPLAIVKSIGWAGISLIWRLPYPTDLTVGRLPLMTISLLALAAFGGYAMWTRARRQTYGLAGLLASSIFFAGINNQLTLLLPAIMVLCVFAAAGLRYLYVEWNSIFPRNPLPRYTAIILMILLIGLHLFYGFRYAQIAWPNSPATKRVYVLEYGSQ